MNKDVIYIDVEDDITAIIGKVKASKDSVVALVPPKRTGVLQSAVNLRLLQRSAKQADKKLALVTSNSALTALAAAASIPVAKNLQSKPELADVAVMDDDEDEIIDGSKLPVGEHASQVDSLDADDKHDLAAATVLATAPTEGSPLKKGKAKKRSTVPNFDKFRKRFILLIIAFILLIAFLVWALFFAPRATVVISAKTADSSVNVPVSIASTLNTDADKGTLKAVMQQESSDETTDFTPTGKEDKGKKATGVVRFSTETIPVSTGNRTIPAGTSLTSESGKEFITDTTVTLTQTESEGSTGVTAAEKGSSYNAADGPLTGAPEEVNSDFNDATSGGVTKVITVVSGNDVQKAKQSIAGGDTDRFRDALKEKFPDGTIVLSESFDVSYAEGTVSPAIGEEADGKATLSTKVTYRMYGAPKEELSSFLKKYLEEQTKDDKNQRIYEDGSENALFQEVSKINSGAKATLVATAQVGPEIKDQDVKNQAKGKRYGEIQQSLEAIQGVNSVDIQFFPFWISTVPDNDDRITVDFKLENE